MMKIINSFLTLLITICFITIETIAGGKNFTWTGNSTDWNSSSNWNPEGTPSSGDVATIPTGLNNYPIINSGTLNIKDVKIDGTGMLTINGGELVATGKIEFLSTTSPYGSVIQSGGTISVKDLIFTGAGLFNQSASSLLTVSRDYKNGSGGTFNSIIGTI